MQEYWLVLGSWTQLNKQEGPHHTSSDGRGGPGHGFQGGAQNSLPHSNIHHLVQDVLGSARDRVVVVALRVCRTAGFELNGESYVMSRNQQYCLAGGITFSRDMGCFPKKAVAPQSHLVIFDWILLIQMHSADEFACGMWGFTLDSTRLNDAPGSALGQCTCFRGRWESITPEAQKPGRGC